VEIKEEKGYRIADIQAVSGTILLDQKKSNRVFQKKVQTYMGIASTVTADTEHSACILPGSDMRTGGTLIQYQETDWRFLKRMASQLGLPLSDIETILPFDNASFKILSVSALLAPINFCPFPPVVDKCLGFTYALLISKLSKVFFPAVNISSTESKPLWYAIHIGISEQSFSIYCFYYVPISQSSCNR
jgi:hypothetical protein